MSESARVDVAMNIFAKPYQTALSLLSLLQFSGRHIGRIYLQFEPQGSMFDPAPPYAIAEYLGDFGIWVVNYQPKYWLHLDAADPARLDDPEYRLSLRYQHAFEHTDKQYLFVLHNDVLIKRDIVGAMLDDIGDAFAVGQIGQCWNCPASNEALVQDSGCASFWRDTSSGLFCPPGQDQKSPTPSSKAAPSSSDTKLRHSSKPGFACAPERYRDFRPDFEGLKRLYALAVEREVFVRPYWEGWEKHYAAAPWPLPECRVNEWGCLVDVAMTRPLVRPEGDILPFGGYEPCGKICLDIDVVWFRELNRRGLYARHMDIRPYLTHWVGTGNNTERKYLQSEHNARRILEKHFAPFAAWCRARGNGLFAGPAS
jgi:hypothetical protein